MKSAFLPDAERYQRAHRRRRIWYRVVTGLAAVVVFCTTYALILPAITLENTYICEQAEHLHGEDCWGTALVEQVTTALTCAPECHSHSPECYDDSGQLICGLADRLLHSHDASCCDDSGQLICTLPEVVEHLHDESCYQETRELICGQEETYHVHGEDCYAVQRGEMTCTLDEGEEHQHTDECYDWEQVLTCEIPEDPEGHLHSEACYQLTCTLACPLEQIAAHEHGPDCYDGTGALVCGILSAQTHQHTADCWVSYTDTTEERVLLCDLSEHSHTEACLPQKQEPEEPEAPEAPEEPESVSEAAQAVIDQIEALPTAQRVADILAEYESWGYQEGYTGYFSTVAAQAKAVYIAYQGLTAEEQAQVTNADKLLELEWLWSAETLTESFDFAAPTVVESASTSEFIDLNLYDYVSLNDVSGENSINKYYREDTDLPGFQWNGGAYMASDTYDRHKVDYIDFGNSNITDIGYGSAREDTRENGLSTNSVIVASNGGAINALDISTYGVTNRPIGMSTGADVLSRTLQNGYPALADGTSLAYLFQDGIYVKKQNTQSIDGLFQKNETTGAYYYNSRWNHAQYSNNTFTLYDQIITPNFIVYPFGNFLPFNDITDSTRATQVSSINGESGHTVSDYVEKIQGDMAGSLSVSPTKTQLNTMLEKYQSSISGTNIQSAQDAIVDYFTGGGDDPSDDTSLINDALLSRMYNIDWDEETDFFFGMDMSMSFMQPRGGLTGNDGQQPMEFYFTGDDDVWVYIDDVLFLDLTGIHRHVGGKIDFVNGVVSYYALDTAGTGDVSNTPYATYTFQQLLTAAGKSTDCLNEKGTFKDYTTHSFKFYYMERGSGSSVCRLNFNFPLLRQNSISVTKELTVDDESKLPLLGDPDFKFQVLKADGTGLFIGANVSYDILDASGNSAGTGRTDANGVFTLKAGQTAVFSNINENAGEYFVRELLDASVFEQYGTVTVDGTSTTKDSYTDSTVGSDSFKGVDSPVKNVSDGSTVFCFNNQVTTDKLGSLRITKTVTDYEKARTAKQFQFEVTLDGEPLPTGTAYQVGEETRYSTAGGIITLSPDETATISSILAGTKFTVTETEQSAEGYIVSYTVDNGEMTSGSASGVIGLGTAVAVTVNNAETGASVTIPVQKTLLYPDGKEHTYHFTLTQVTDSSGTTETPDGTAQTLDIPVTTETVTQAFVLDYPLVDLGTLPQTFYYKITEERSENTSTIYDQSVYIVEVTVNDTDSGDLQAAITGIWRNGASLTTDTEVGSVAFTNQIQRYELPATGGSGTHWYYIAGAALLTAGLLYSISRRRRGERTPR